MFLDLTQISNETSAVEGHVVLDLEHGDEGHHPVTKAGRHLAPPASLLARTDCLVFVVEQFKRLCRWVVLLANLPHRLLVVDDLDNCFPGCWLAGWPAEERADIAAPFKLGPIVIQDLVHG